MTSEKKKTTDYPWLQNYPPYVSWDAEIPIEPLYHLLDRAVERFPKHCCLTFMGKNFTFKEIGDLVNRTTKGLQKIGVKKGTKIGLFLPNCPQYVIFYFAILKTGGTVVNFNPLYAFKEIKHQAEDAGISMMVTLDLNELYTKIKNLSHATSLEKIIVARLQDFLPFPKNILFPLLRHKEVSAMITGLKNVTMASLLNNDGKYTPVPIDPKQDVALLQYTGGTTGTPKGAMLSHANLYANAYQSAVWFNIEEGKETVLGVLPFFHVFAMTAIMNFSIYKGARIILHPRFNLKQLIKDIKRYKITLVAGVPTMFSAINHSTLLKRYSLVSLKSAISGGAPLPLEIKTAFEKISECPLVEGYGLTEAAPVVAVNPLKLKSHASLTATQTTAILPVGLPLPRTIVSIRDPDNTHNTVPLGEMGEVCVEGPQVMLGYYNKPEETSQVLVDGILRTGDMGYIDAEGYIYVVDRLKELIIVGGYNIYPRNVEAAIYQHPSVEEVAVIGVPHDHKGQTVTAYVKLKRGYDASAIDLKLFLKDFLATFEIPTEIHFVDTLPKTMVGKICKKDLKKP